jgi:hypothetical protein
MNVDVHPVVLPPVLDACCSTRMMWFDKQDTRALYIDKREGTRVIDVGTPGNKRQKTQNCRAKCLGRLPRNAIP